MKENNNEHIPDADLMDVIHQANRDHASDNPVQYTGLNLSNLRGFTRESVDAIKAYQGYFAIFGVDTLHGDIAAELANVAFDIEFVNLKTLELDAATQLGFFKGDCLSFLGMESISPDALGALLHNFKGRLALGLMELTVNIARELAQAHRDSVTYFTRLKSLSVEAAFWLNKSQSSLSFDVLDSITPEAARVLVHNYHHSIGFHALRIDTIELAKAIAIHPDDLILDGIADLNHEIAEVLMTHKGQHLSLRGVKKIDLKTAEILVRYEEGEKNTKYLSLALEEIDADVAAVFSKADRGLRFGCLRSISDDVALILSKSPCNELILNDEIKMSESARELIFNFNGHFNLRDEVWPI